MDNYLANAHNRNNMQSVRDIFSHPNIQNRAGISIIARLIREQTNITADMSDLVNSYYNNSQNSLKPSLPTTSVIMRVAADRSESAATKANLLRDCSSQISDLSSHNDLVVSRLFTSSIYSANSANEFAKSAKSKYRQFVQEKLTGKA